MSYPGRLNKAPIAIEALERIDALFAIERDIKPATISTIIIAAVTPITMRVRRSACEKSGTKSCAFRNRE